MSIDWKKVVLHHLQGSMYILLSGIFGTGVVLADSEEPLSWQPASMGTPASFKLGADQSGPMFVDGEFSPEFKKILSSNPAALQEAERIGSASATIVAGWVVLLAGTIVELKATMDQADDPLAESESGKGLGLVIGGAIVTLIGTSIYKGHINSSIQMYNEGVKQGSRRATTRLAKSLQFGLEFDPGYSAASNGSRADVALLGTLKMRF